MKKFLLLALLLSVTACNIHFGHFEQDRQTADAAADRFHALLKDGKYADMYALASTELRANISETAFIAANENAIQTYGEFRQAAQLRAACVPNHVTLIYQSDFANERIIETMTWKINDGKAELINLQITPGEADLEKLPKSSCGK